MRSLFPKQAAPWGWFGFSLAVSLTLVFCTKAPAGDFLGRFTDHVHHTRMTWTFLHVGLDVYTRPFGETAALAPYPQNGVTWEQYPMAYPPGMLLVFLPPAILGRFVKLTENEFGRCTIAYLVVVAHVALRRMTPLFARIRSTATPLFVVMTWIFVVHSTLLGFYDGVWLLTAALAAHAWLTGKADEGLLWLAAASLLSFRAICLAPLGLVLCLQLVRQPIPGWRKVAALVATVAAGGLVVLAFWTFLRHSPTDHHGVDSALMPLSFRGYALIAFGLAVAVVAGLRSSWAVGCAIAISTFLSILHAGHTWHGMVCLTPFFLLAGTNKVDGWVGWLVTGWFAIFLQFAYGYAPFDWVEELIRFAELDGRFVR